MEKKTKIQPIVFDKPSFERLQEMARVEDRSLSAMVRLLVNAAWARKFQAAVSECAAACEASDGSD